MNHCKKLFSIINTTIASRSPTILAAEVDGEIVMLSVNEGAYFGLDCIGSDIWRRLDLPISFGELVDRLTAEYDANRETIAADVRSLLLQMVEHDVVRLS
jgi:Coenzyme PQQ synthesis protein D (PqqD)